MSKCITLGINSTEIRQNSLFQRYENKYLNIFEKSYHANLKNLMIITELTHSKPIMIKKHWTKLHNALIVAKKKRTFESEETSHNAREYFALDITVAIGSYTFVLFGNVRRNTLPLQT